MPEEWTTQHVIKSKPLQEAARERINYLTTKVAATAAQAAADAARAEVEMSVTTDSTSIIFSQSSPLGVAESMATLTNGVDMRHDVKSSPEYDNPQDQRSHDHNKIAHGIGTTIQQDLECSGSTNTNIHVQNHSPKRAKQDLQQMENKSTNLSRDVTKLQPESTEIHPGISNENQTEKNHKQHVQSCDDIYCQQVSEEHDQIVGQEKNMQLEKASESQHAGGNYSSDPKLTLYTSSTLVESSEFGVQTSIDKGRDATSSLCTNQANRQQMPQLDGASEDNGQESIGNQATKSSSNCSPDDVIKPKAIPDDQPKPSTRKQSDLEKASVGSELGSYTISILFALFSFADVIIVADSN